MRCMARIYSVNILKQNGFTAHGVETSKAAAEKCKTDGFDVKHGLLEEFKLPSNSYDIITMYEVIEHLLDPTILLQECHRLLKPNGLLFISTGNTDSWTAKILREKWDYFDLQINGYGHISFFNPTSLTKLTQTIGFKTEAIETRRVKLFSENNTDSLKNKILKIAQELLAPLAKFFKKGHDMTVVLRK